MDVCYLLRGVIRNFDLRKSVSDNRGDGKGVCELVMSEVWDGKSTANGIAGIMGGFSLSGSTPGSPNAARGNFDWSVYTQRAVLRVFESAKYFSVCAVALHATPSSSVPSIVLVHVRCVGLGTAPSEGTELCSLFVFSSTPQIVFFWGSGIRNRSALKTSPCGTLRQFTRTPHHDRFQISILRKPLTRTAAAPTSHTAHHLRDAAP